MSAVPDEVADAICIVFLMEARGGPNIEVRAECLVVTTGHFFEDKIGRLPY